MLPIDDETIVKDAAVLSRVLMAIDCELNEFAQRHAYKPIYEASVQMLRKVISDDLTTALRALQAREIEVGEDNCEVSREEVSARYQEYVRTTFASINTKSPA